MRDGDFPIFEILIDPAQLVFEPLCCILQILGRRQKRVRKDHNGDRFAAVINDNGCINLGDKYIPLNLAHPHRQPVAITLHNDVRSRVRGRWNRRISKGGGEEEASTCVAEMSDVMLPSENAKTMPPTRPTKMMKMRSVWFVAVMSGRLERTQEM